MPQKQAKQKTKQKKEIQERRSFFWMQQILKTIK
jgi:hypothetical protein